MTFLVESHFNVIPTPDILALIPAESARGAQLDAEGVRLHLFIAADQSRAWQIFRAGSPAELERILSTFPLHRYTSTSVTPLAGAASED